MNALEQFYIDLDNSDWDHHNEDAIISNLSEVNKANLKSVEQSAKIERHVFLFKEPIQKGLAPQYSETGWPDTSCFNKDDFDYINSRFSNCINTYAKTKYGLVLFYAKEIEHNIVSELLNLLFELLKLYLIKGKEDRFYIFSSQNVVTNLLHIAKRRKKEVIFKNVVHYIFDVFQKWDINDAKFENITSIFSRIYFDHFNNVSEIIDLRIVLDKNYNFILKQTDKDYETIWKALQLIDVSVKLSNKLKTESLKNKFLHLDARLNEKVAEIRKGDLMEITFIEKAMRLYRILNDDENLKRLQEKYQNLRTKQNLNSAVFEPNQGFTDLLHQIIENEIKNKNEEEVIRTLSFTPMLEKLETIKKQSKSLKEEQPQYRFGTHIISDKFGNTLAVFSTNSEEDKKQISLFNTYKSHLDFSSITIVNYFLHAYQVKKITADGITNYLSNSWLGESAVRQINNVNHNFSYIKSIQPSLSIFFDELKKWQSDKEYHPNFIPIIDSLILKSEYLIREICYKLKIPTFRPKDAKKEPGIVMEKTLDHLLNNLKGIILEDDHFFLQFVLTNKVGYNLRNRIAHGLMDDFEYELKHVLLAIIIILKLSNYQFKIKEVK